ncbi:MAG: glycosyltransferase family 2 protein [Bacteroidales bacterium]
MSRLSIIIPCYFNEQNIPVTFRALSANESNFPPEVEIEYIFIDDGSKDNTWNEIIKLTETNPQKIKGIKLVANVGSFTAIVAGMEYATGDFNVILAADLQDPPELMVQMYHHWNTGYKLVIGNRVDRKDSFGQKLFANTFHYLMKKLAIPNIPDGGFDYVMFDKEIRERIVAMQEKNTNIFYLMVWMGYPYVNLPYTRQKREIGKSRWTWRKRVKLFVDSFVSFSYYPLRMISVMGIVLGFAALAYAGVIIIARLTGTVGIRGWSANMVVLLFVSAFQMIALGIIGEYVWRNLDATKKRPLYIIDKITATK